MTYDLRMYYYFKIFMKYLWNKIYIHISYIYYEIYYYL